MILQQGGTYLTDDGKVDFTSDEAVTAMKELMSMVEDGECSLENLSAGEYSYNDVYQDKAYMASVGTWAIGEGTDTYDLTYGEDFEYVAAPQYGDTLAFTSESGWGLVVPNKAKDTDASWKFVEFFTQPENLVEHNIACNQLPPRKDMLEDETYLEAMSNIDFILDILPYGQWRGPINASAMNDVLNKTFTDLCQEENPDVKSALQQMSDEINETCLIGYSQ